MNEVPLVAFTLLSQMAVGMAWTLGVLHVWATNRAVPPSADGLAAIGWPVIALLMAIALLASFSHLGVRRNAWRAIGGWCTSWLSREILAATTFTSSVVVFVVLQCLVSLPPVVTHAITAVVALLGLILIYAMTNAYRLPTVPAWDTPITLVSFLSTALALGGLAAGVLLAFRGGRADAPLRWIALEIIACEALNLGLTALWVARLSGGSRAATAAATAITQAHRAAFSTRLWLAALAMLGAGLMLALLPGEAALRLVVTLTFGLACASEVFGRLLFYVGHVKHDVYLYPG